MIEIINQISAVSETLKRLFAADGQLHGFNDWDALVGCVMMLESVAMKLSEAASAESSEAEEEEPNG